jgi:hypothetical protein
MTPKEIDSAINTPSDRPGTKRPPLDLAWLDKNLGEVADNLVNGKKPGRRLAIYRLAEIRLHLSRLVKSDPSSTTNPLGTGAVASGNPATNALSQTASSPVNVADAPPENVTTA